MIDHNRDAKPHWEYLRETSCRATENGPGSGNRLVKTDRNITHTHTIRNMNLVYRFSIVFPESVKRTDYFRELTMVSTMQNWIFETLCTLKTNKIINTFLL